MVHLHVHTKYSLLDATIKIEDLIERLKEVKQDTIAVTDHGNLYANVEAYKKLTEAGIKYIMGCEMYICDDTEVRDKDNRYYHLILLAKNDIGRLNLQKLVSESTKYKYYGKPRIDFEMLKKYSDGLICLSACMAGEISRHIINNDLIKVETTIEKYSNLFGEDYYLEFQAHSDKVQQDLNLKIVELAKQHNIKYVVTCDAHYLKQEDQKYHSIFTKIGTTREAGEIYNDCYIQSEEDILNKCVSTKEYNKQAIQNTHEIANKCNVKIPLSAPIIPHVEIPNNFKSEIEYLKYLCNKGWKDKKLNLLPKEEQQVYRDRAKYEMNAIEKMGFEGYYLLVYSYVTSVIRRGIARGSGGGSLIAYLCNIVDINPVKYGLYFERFIDVGALELLENGTITRKELKIPDFDTDFSPSDRDKVIQFIIDKFGKDNVVALGSFQYIWARGAIKDIGKVLGVPFEITNEMTKNLEDETIEEALDRGVLDKYKDQHPELFEYASKLSGLPKSFSMHPCGKVVCMENAVLYNAIELSDTGEWVLQGDMHTADDLGLVKIDLLGLRTLDVIYDVLDMISKDYRYIAPHNINFNNELVWKEFSLGHTDGIFQFESDGMKHMLREMGCDNIEILSAANALYRPGSKEYIPNYINRKKGLEEITYLHEDLKPILSNTYGIIVFQEQLIEIGRLAELKNPDELRKATSKKKPKLMAKIEPELKNGLINRGWNDCQVGQLWLDILQFAKYSFNKSHSQSYAIIAYICMYLKVYHPNEFITAWINSYGGETKKIAKCVAEAKRMGLYNKYPKYNNAVGITTYKDNTIWLGTNTMKFSNNSVASELLSLNFNESNFLTLLQKIQSTSINTKQMTALIIFGFFDKFGKNNKLLTTYNLYQSFWNKKQVKKVDIGKKGLDVDIIKKYTTKETEKQFNGIDFMGYIQEIYKITENKDLPIADQINYELEYLGYIQTTIPSLSLDYAYITNIDGKFKNKNVTLYRLQNGETEIVKVKAKAFEDNELLMGDVIKTVECSREKKWGRTPEGEYYQKDEYETILKKWIFVR